MESEVEEEELLSTLAHEQGLRLTGMTCAAVSFHSLGVRSPWTVQPHSLSRHYEVVTGAPSICYMIPPTEESEPNPDDSESSKATCLQTADFSPTSLRFRTLSSI
jgi:hypothetical protein